MSEKRKKQKMEFRYYQMPPGSPILALIGDKWIQNYGNNIRDWLHFHNYMEIGYCYFGNGVVKLGDIDYRFSGKQFTVIPPNFPHTTNSDTKDLSKWEYLFVDIDDILKNIVNENALKREHIKRRLYENAMFLEEEKFPKEAGRIKEIFEIMRNPDEFYVEEAKGVMISFLAEIARINRNSDEEVNLENGRITQIVSRTMDYISEHYMDKVKVNDIADYCHVSETHLRRVFLKHMSIGLLEYVNTVRIRTACEYLKKTDDSVADIADKCGFTTNSTFNRNFKRIMGVTPVEWRKRPENYEQKILKSEVHTEKGW